MILCPICKNKFEARHIDRIEYTICEEYGDCPCGVYYYEFLYGYTIERIGKYICYSDYHGNTSVTSEPPNQPPENPENYTIYDIDRYGVISLYSQ